MPGTYSKKKHVISGETITAFDRNEEHDNHITFQTPAGTDDYSANITEMRVNTDPYPAGAEAVPTDLAGELARLRYMVKQLHGKAQWYIDPSINLNAFVSTSAYTTLALAVTAAGTGTLLVDSNVTLIANTAFTIPIFVLDGVGRFTSASTYTLDFNASFTAGNSQVFYGFGTSYITFGPGSVSAIKDKWFGVATDGTDAAGANTTACQAFVNCVHRSHTEGKWSEGHIKFTKLYLGYHANNTTAPTTGSQGRYKITGHGRQDYADFVTAPIKVGTVLESTDATGPGIVCDFPTSPYITRNITLHDFSVIATNTTYILQGKDCFHFNLERISLYQAGATGGGIQWEGSDQNHWDMVWVFGDDNSIRSGIGLWIYNVVTGNDGANSLFRNVQVRAFDVCWQLGHLTAATGYLTWNDVFINCLGFKGNTGLLVATKNYYHTFINCVFKGRTRALNLFQDCKVLDFLDCSFILVAGGSPVAVVDIGTDTGPSVHDIFFRECRNDLEVTGSNLPNLKITSASGVYNIIFDGGEMQGQSASAGLVTTGVVLGLRGLETLNWTASVSVATNILTEDYITAAATITLASETGVITGATDIKSITPPRGAEPGFLATLRFQSTSTASLLHSFTTTAITTLTSSGITATAVRVGHGLTTGDGILIQSTTQTEYNGYFVVTVLDADTFTYLFPGSATTPATGAPTFHYGNLWLNEDFQDSGTVSSVGGNLGRQITLRWTGQIWYEVSRGTNGRQATYTTANLPAAAAANNGRLLIEAFGSGQALVAYEGAESNIFLPIERQSPAYNANLTPDCSKGLVYAPATLTGNTVIAAPTNPKDGMVLQFIFLSDGSARTITFNAIFRTYTTGTMIANVLTSVLSKYSAISFTYHSTDNLWLQRSPDVTGL